MDTITLMWWGIALSMVWWVRVMKVVVIGATVPQPGLEPDRLELMATRVKEIYGRLKLVPSQLIRHHAVKVYRAWLTWQGYVPTTVRGRVVWVPTHTML